MMRCGREDRGVIDNKDEIETLKARLRELENRPAESAPSAVGPASGFAVGFFGFFGVVAAILAVVVVGFAGFIALVAANSSRDSSGSGSEASGAAPAYEVTTACQQALLVAKRDYFGFEGVDPDHPPPVNPLANGHMACGVRVGDAELHLEFHAICPSPVDLGCVKIDGATLNGTALYRKRG